jgi:hypothetical protein
MRGARFAWAELRNAQISGNEVAIQILGGDDDGAPGAESDATEDDEARTDEPRPGLPVAEASRLHI